MNTTGGTTALDRTRTAKVFAVLQGLSQGGCARLTNVAERTGLPMTTTHRLLGELVELGIVERTVTGYQLGSALFELAQSSPICSELLEAAQPYLQDLYELTHQVIHVAVLDDSDALVVEKISGHGSALVPARVGTRLSLHATSLGKCLLAFSTPDALQGIGTYGLHHVGPRTVTSWSMLGEQLATARSVGYSVEYEEWRVGLASLAAPVLIGGSAVAVVSVTTKTSDFDALRLGPLVRKAAHGIATRVRCNMPVAV